MKPVKITKQDQFGYERTFVIRRDETCGKEKSSMARCLCLEQPSIAIIEDIEAISAVSYPYVSDFVDISYIVNLCRLDKFDAHRILRQLNDAGSVVFEVTVAYLLSQSI